MNQSIKSQTSDWEGGGGCIMGLEPGTNRTIITFISSLYVTDGRPGQVLPTYMMTSS